MKWALVPEKEGLYNIHPIVLSYFNTDTYKYDKLETSLYNLRVLPNEKEENQKAILLENEKKANHHLRR